MFSYLQANLDCVLFTQSIALLVMAIQARYLERHDKSLAWRWLLFFSIFQALYAWCCLLDGAKVLFHMHPFGEKTLWMLSFICLAEFARVSTPQTAKWKYGFWLHPPLALLLAATLRTPIALALSTGLSAGVWSSWALWKASARKNLAEASIRLRSVALFLPAYAVSAAIGSRAPYLDARSSAAVWGLGEIVSLVFALGAAVFAILLFCFLHGYHSACRPKERLEDPDDTGLRSRHLWSGLCVLVLVGGWLCAALAGHRHENAQREEIKSRTRLVAASLSPQTVTALRGDEADAKLPGYSELKKQLRSLAEASGDFRYIALVASGANGTSLLVDSELAEPGALDFPAPPEQRPIRNQQRFSGRQAVVLYGPFEDRHGTWISTSVLLPLTTAEGNPVTLEIDVAASDWQAQVLRARLPVLALTLLVTAFLVGSLLTQENVRRHAALTAISEHRNSSIIAASPDCILMFDADGTCVSVNQAGLRSLCLPEEKILNRNFSSFWPEHAQTMVIEALRRARLGKSTLFEADYVRPDFRITTFRVAINPVQDTKGRVRAIVGICVDITARKYMERDLVAAKEAAEAATRAKSEFLAVMSHEIRTPLGGVIGMLGLLQKQQLQNRERRYAELARECAENLLEILNDILDTAKIESGKFTLESIPFRPRKVFGRVVDIMRTRADAKELDLAFDLSPSVPEILVGDPTRLRQVISNLVSNAIKFTSSGGVKVAIEAAQEGPGSVVLTIAVTDSGIGIPDDSLKVIFNKFEQADSTTTREYGGTGLGLAIVKGIADIMGGRVEVRSEVGKGTTFTFRATLPVGRPEDLVETAAEPDRQGAAKAPSLALSLLCAEDNATNRVIVQYIVRHMGHEVDFVENGKEAVERLRTMRYDAVLMDSRMPVMDGLQATRLIRDPSSGVLDPRIPIISLTANASTSHIEQCKAAGMDAFLEKPVREDALAEALERVAARRSPVAAANAEVRAQQNAAADEAPKGLSASELLAMMREQEQQEASPAPETSTPAPSRAIMTQYLSDAPARVREMSSALKSGDLDTLGRAAHSLKSISRYVAAIELSELGAQIEALADAGNTREVPRLIEQAELELESVKRRLEGILSH